MYTLTEAQHVVSMNGSALGRVKTKEMLITPIIAKEWIENYSFENQRKVRPHWVSFLADEMKSGGFQSHTSIQVVIDRNGHHTVTDGQHRLRAIVQSGIPQVFLVVFRDGDPGREYTMHDRGMPRTIIDVFSALDLPTQLGLHSKNVRYLGSAAKFILSDFTQKQAKIHDDVLLSCMREYAPAAQEYFQCVTGGEDRLRDPLRRIATVSIGLVTFRYAPGVAWNFWRGISLNDGLRNGDPRKVAHTHLTTTRSYNARVADGLTSVRPEYSAQYLCNCWNAWVENRKITKTLVKSDSVINCALTPLSIGS